MSRTAHFCQNHFLPTGFCVNPLSNNGTVIQNSNDSNQYPVNTMITHECLDGFVLAGASDSYCKSWVRWQPPPGECVPNDQGK